MLPKFRPAFLNAPIPAIGSLLLLFLLTACSTQKAQPAPQVAPAAPVVVAKAIAKAVPFEIQTVGNVEAYSSITVIPQVGGELMTVDFQEGADVKKGDRLFVIDPRPYETQVAQAEANLVKDRAQVNALEANLARDTAQEDYIRAQSQRYDKLLEQGILAKDSSEQMRTQVTAIQEALRAGRAAIESARATIAADQTALDRARLQLEYCTIRSPIDGRTGQLSVREGNVLRTNDAGLVTINQLTPAFVTFSVPEAGLPAIRRYMASGKVDVLAYPEGDSDAVVTGSLSFVENTVDTTTGTIRMKATFGNADRKLWPGQFVRALIRLNATVDSVVVPVTAVQTGQDGQFVFIVKSDMTVEARPVVTGRTVDRGIVIENGVAYGETVVTEGQVRLTTGSRIQIKEDRRPS